jgi:hypothetical protein
MVLMTASFRELLAQQAPFTTKCYKRLLRSALIAIFLISPVHGPRLSRDARKRS